MVSRCPREPESPSRTAAPACLILRQRRSKGHSLANRNVTRRRRETLPRHFPKNGSKSEQRSERKQMNFFVGKKSAFSGTSVNSPMSSGVVKFKSRDSPLSASVRLPLPKVASLIEEDPEPSFDERLVSKASRRKWRARAGWGVRGVGGGCLRWLRERGEREEIPPPPSAPLQAQTPRRRGDGEIELPCALCPLSLPPRDTMGCHMERMSLQTPPGGRRLTGMEGIGVIRRRLFPPKIRRAACSLPTPPSNRRCLFFYPRARPSRPARLPPRGGKGGGLHRPHPRICIHLTLHRIARPRVVPTMLVTPIALLPSPFTHRVRSPV